MKKLWILKMVLMGALFIAAIGFVLMHLWNWLVPDIFGFSEITFLQALGLFLLSKILFGLGKCKGNHHHKGNSWKQKWQDKWKNMPDEQREKLKKQFASKWCVGHDHEEIKEDEEGKP